MAYKKKQTSRKMWAYTGKTSTKPRPFGFYALIRLDISMVKEELLRKWKKAERDFEKQQKEWDAYCNEDRPAYEKWLHATFGSRLTELRELHEQVSRKSWFIEQLECLSDLSGKTPRKLYQELQKKTKNGMSIHDAMVEYVNEFNAYDDEFDDDDDEFDGEDALKEEFDRIFEDLGEFGEEDGDFKEEFKKVFENFEDIFGDRKKTSGGNHGSGNKTPGIQQARIKDIYRKLCFKLHPDTGCDFNAENSRLWHQIQEAYQKNDLDSLLAVQASLDMKQDPMAGHISCTQILAVINNFKTGLRSVRELVRNARQDSSWGFLTWSDKERKAAMRQLEQQFIREQHSLKYELEYMESIEKKWSRPTVPRPKPKPKPETKAKTGAKARPEAKAQTGIKTKPESKEKTPQPDYSSPAEQYVQPDLFNF